MNHNHHLLRNLVFCIAGCCITFASASDWILRNGWNDQYHPETWVTPVGGNAVNIHYRSWGKTDFWMINTSDAVPVTSGNSYTVTFSLVNAQQYGVSGIKAALVSGWEWSGPTGSYTLVATQGTFTPGQAVTAELSVPADFTGNAYLAGQDVYAWLDRVVERRGEPWPS